MVDYIGPNGQHFSTSSIQARVSKAAQAAADRIIAQNTVARDPEQPE